MPALHTYKPTALPVHGKVEGVTSDDLCDTAKCRKTKKSDPDEKLKKKNISGKRERNDRYDKTNTE